jgi:CheY-like chemotaxis protein
MFPAFRAKTSAIFVDDEREFLDDICDFLPDTHNFIKSLDPISSIETIQHNLSKYKNFPFNKMNNLWCEFNGFQFDNIISVAVIDYQMSPISGIELCRQIKAPFIKKIMLTSYAKEKIAIDALNNKIIDAFLLKTDANIENSLAKTMEDCTKQFFCELSSWIKNYQNSQNPLLSNKVDEHLSKFLEENKIVQYCCFHDFNTIWFRSHDGKERYLTIYSEDTLEELLATDQSICASRKIIDDISQKKAAPCFPYRGTPLTPDGKTWASFMRPLLKIDNHLYSTIY